MAKRGAAKAKGAAKGVVSRVRNTIKGKKPSASPGASMADLKGMTVRALRELARKHLGAGYSRLKTKSELVTALSKALPKSIQQALEPNAATAPKPAKAAAAEHPAAKAASSKNTPAKPPAEKPAAPKHPAAPAAPSAEAPEAAEPDPEGYMVSRVVGEAAAHSAHIPLVEQKVPPHPPASREPELFDEKLGELPDTYGDDSVVLLPKDPRTLFLYWDFSHQTVQSAFEWMPGVHTKLRLYADNQLAREADFALESRSWYFYDLEPGRTYHAELMSVGNDGQSRRIGPASNSIAVPAEGPSPVVDDRFVRIPIDVPRSRLAEAMRQSAEMRGTPPPFQEQAREELYQISGGAARALGSSEQQAEAAARGEGGEGRGGSRSSVPGVRSSGPWPWSGSVPRRS